MTSQPIADVDAAATQLDEEAVIRARRLVHRARKRTDQLTRAPLDHIGRGAGPLRPEAIARFVAIAAQDHRDLDGRRLRPQQAA